MLRVQKYKRSDGRSDDTKRVMDSFLFFIFFAQTKGCLSAA